MGRVTTVVGVLLSIAAAYVATRYNNIMDLLQLVFGFVNAPLFATFLLGMFWKRTTGARRFRRTDRSAPLAAVLTLGTTMAEGKGGWIANLHTFPVANGAELLDRDHGLRHLFRHHRRGQHGHHAAPRQGNGRSGLRPHQGPARRHGQVVSTPRAADCYRGSVAAYPEYLVSHDMDLRVPSGWFFTLAGLILAGWALYRAGCARAADRRQRQSLLRHLHARFRTLPAADGLARHPAEQSVIDDFRRLYGSADGVRVFRAPGRVNLIGEHTDYNLGFVLPVALDLATYIATAPAGDGNCTSIPRSARNPPTWPVERNRRARRRAATGRDYPIGVAQELIRAGFAIAPANLLIRSTVPEGSGLSSSAALEVSSALALLGGRRMAPLELARLCQRAERNFVGMPCGIMDQYISVFGEERAAICIDCRSLKHQVVRLPAGVAFVAVNTMVKHELAGSAYKERTEAVRRRGRRSCAAAIRASKACATSRRPCSRKPNPRCRP